MFETLVNGLDPSWFLWDVQVSATEILPRPNVWNISFGNILKWSIYIINSLDEIEKIVLQYSPSLPPRSTIPPPPTHAVPKFMRTFLYIEI